MYATVARTFDWEEQGIIRFNCPFQNVSKARDTGSAPLKALLDARLRYAHYGVHNASIQLHGLRRRP